MSTPNELLNVLVKTPRLSARDRLMVLVQGTLGLDANSLRRLTLRQAVAHLAPRRKADTSGLINRVLNTLGKLRQQGTQPDDLLFPNRRSARHPTPRGRTGLFRVLQHALRHALGPNASSPLRTLQSLAKALTGQQTYWHTTQGYVSPTPLSDADRAMLALVPGLARAGPG